MKRTDCRRYTFKEKKELDLSGKMPSEKMKWKDPRTKKHVEKAMVGLATD